MRDHDGLRQTRRAARVGQKRRLARPLAAGPPQGLERRRGVGTGARALGDERLDGDEPAGGLEPGHAHEPDLVGGQAGGGRGLEADLQLRAAEEQGLGARGPELVGELGGRIRRVGGGDDAVEPVDGVRDSEVINLGTVRQRLLSLLSHKLGLVVAPGSLGYVCRISRLTVLNEKMHATLSHSVSSLGNQAMRLPTARARASRRWLNSSWVKVLPVRPQVKGFLLLATGWRPW